MTYYVWYEDGRRVKKAPWYDPTSRQQVEFVMSSGMMQTVPVLRKNGDIVDCKVVAVEESKD